jgi:High potential iron-sulfur protein
MSKLTRREFTLAGMTAGLSTLLWSSQSSAAPGAVDVGDPTAKALGFVMDAAKVDAAANPMFKPGQRCVNCMQYQGKATDASAPCAIFGGKSVPGAAWCKVWAQRAQG